MERRRGDGVGDPRGHAQRDFADVFPAVVLPRPDPRGRRGAASGFVQWFGGVWRDEKSFLRSSRVDAGNFFPIYPEFVFKPGEFSDLLRDRQGCVVGRQLADLYGFKVGDRLPIRGTIYPGNWEFNIRAIL